jgi:hypothetical protein
MSQSTAARKLPGDWEYLVLIQGTQGFSAVFDGSGEPKAAVLAAVFSRSFQQRLERVALTIADTLFVEVIGFEPGNLKMLSDFRLRNEGPTVLVMQATYDEGEILRHIHDLQAATV